MDERGGYSSEESLQRVTAKVLETIRQKEESLHSPFPEISVLDIFNTFIVDSSGVPLDSDRSPKEEITAGLDFEYLDCPFKDSPSRYPQGQPHEKKMSGLERKRLAKNYVPSLQILRTFRDAYIKSSPNPDPNRQLSAREAQEMLFGIAHIPQYLVFRAENPLNPIMEVPEEFVVTSNATLGAIAALGSYARDSKDGMNAIAEPKALVELSEKTEKMVGKITVCVASPDQMVHFLNAVISGPNESESKLVPEYIGEEELKRIYTFGFLMRKLAVNIEALRFLDMNTTKKIIASASKQDFETIIDVIENYKKEAVHPISGLIVDNSQINVTLGRVGTSNTITMDAIAESLKLQVPEFNKKLLEKHSN